MNAAYQDFGRAGLGGNSVLAHGQNDAIDPTVDAISRIFRSDSLPDVLQMPRSRRKRIGLFKDLLFAAAHESVAGTFETSRLHRVMSAFGGTRKTFTLTDFF
jgi:hypothetical protein